MFSKLSGNSWCCFYSFWNSIVTRVCQHISGAPGKSVTTLQHHYQSQHLSGKENERHHSGGWNAAVALILLLSAGIWSNLPTINVRKQMGFFSCLLTQQRDFLMHEVVPLISLAVLWLRHSDHSLCIKDSIIFDKTRCLSSLERGGLL